MKIKKAVILIPPKKELVLPMAGPAYLTGALNASGIECRVIEMDHLIVDYLKAEAEHAFIKKYVPDNLDYSEKLQLLSSACFFKDNYPAFAARLEDSLNITEQDRGILKSFIHSVLSQLQNEGVDTIGISFFWFNFSTGLLLASEARKSGFNVIAGGPHISYKETRNWIEQYTSNLFHAAIPQSSLEEILTQLDIPFSQRAAHPDYSNVNMSRYMFPDKYPILIDMGCSHNACSFCNYNHTKQKLVMEPMEHVLSAISMLYEQGISNLYFVSNNVLNDKLNFLRLLEAITSSGMTISWDSQARIDQIDKQTIETCIKSGCRRLYFGVEAISDNLLNVMNKGYGAKEALDKLKLLSEMEKEYEEFSYAFNLIFNHPGETPQDLKNTLEGMRNFPSLFQGKINEMRHFDLVFNSAVYRNPEKFGISIGKGLQESWSPAQAQFPSFLYDFVDNCTYPGKEAFYQEINAEITNFNTYY